MIGGIEESVARSRHADDIRQVRRVVDAAVIPRGGDNDYIGVSCPAAGYLEGLDRLPVFGPQAKIDDIGPSVTDGPLDRLDEQIARGLQLIVEDLDTRNSRFGGNGSNDTSAGGSVPDRIGTIVDQPDPPKVIPLEPNTLFQTTHVRVTIRDTAIDDYDTDPLARTGFDPERSDQNRGNPELYLQVHAAHEPGCASSR